MSASSEDQLRHLPAVGRLLQETRVRDWLDSHPQALVVEALRQSVDEQRRLILAGDCNGTDLLDVVLQRAEMSLGAFTRNSLVGVINATGIVLHTGLGRAPLSRAACAAVQAAAGYCNLEFDLASGARGRRADHVSDLLCRLSGAEAATVVNNNAAATLLILRAMTQQRLPAGSGSRRYRRRNVIVSRGELVEIGGSYRLPEIMKASGTQLKEVGTTNRTRVSDYEQAIDERTAALMKVHTSNYRITGFCESVEIAELVALGRRCAVPVIDDLGSGRLVDLGVTGVDDPSVRDHVAAGADLVCFSGDKLLGGPQAGIIVGRAPYVRAVEQSPLLRTYRVDKLVLAALEATLRQCFDADRARREIPALAMLCESAESVRGRGRLLLEALRPLASEVLELVDETAYAGGGSLPVQRICTTAVRWRPCGLTAAEAAGRLRHADPPIIVRVHRDAVLLDCRTMTDDQVARVATAIERLSAAVDQPAGGRRPGR